MILLDAQDEHPPKQEDVSSSSTVRYPERVNLSARESRSTLLPSYENSQALQSSPPASPLKALLNKQRRNHRFLKAMCVALAIYVVLTIVIAVPILTLKKKPEQRNTTPKSLSAAPWIDQPRSNFFDDDSVPPSSCQDWFGDTSASTSMLFDPSGEFYLRTNVTSALPGLSGVTGQLKVDMNPNRFESSIRISVSINASSPHFLTQSRVCFGTTPFTPNRGVFIYVPDRQNPEDTVSYSISFLFPQTASPIYIDKFLTQLPSFYHHIGVLGSKVFFRTIQLSGAQMKIVCDDIHGGNIAIETLGPISGNFQATEALILDSIEGSIAMNATLKRSEGCGQPTYLYLDTGSSSIKANIILSAPVILPPSCDLPQYYAMMRNHNGPITLDLTHASNTPPVLMDITVQNSQAENHISLDGKFTGFVDLQTRLGAVNITDSPTKSTARGQSGMSRLSYDRQSKTRAMAWIGWDMDKRPPRWRPGIGRLQATSSLSTIYLKLKGSPPPPTP